MKIRSGFVSNSSSSSFCVVGVPLEYDDIKKIEELKNMDLCDLSDYSGEYDFIVEFGYDNEAGLMGIDMHDMKDNDTLKSMKERCWNKIKELGLDEMFGYNDIHIINEEIYS